MNLNNRTISFLTALGLALVIILSQVLFGCNATIQPRAELSEPGRRSHRWCDRKQSHNTAVGAIIGAQLGGTAGALIDVIWINRPKS